MARRRTRSINPLGAGGIFRPRDVGSPTIGVTTRAPNPQDLEDQAESNESGVSVEEIRRRKNARRYGSRDIDKGYL